MSQLFRKVDCCRLTLNQAFPQNKGMSWKGKSFPRFLQQSCGGPEADSFPAQIPAPPNPFYNLLPSRQRFSWRLRQGAPCRKDATRLQEWQLFQEALLLTIPVASLFAAERNTSPAAKRIACASSCP